MLAVRASTSAYCLEMADEKKEDIAAPAGPKMILGLPLPLFALVAANALIMLGGLGYVVQVKLLYKKPAITDSQVVAEIQKKAAKPAAPVDPAAVPSQNLVENYPEMSVNLRTTQGGNPHFVTVEVSLVCPNENCLSQIKAQKAKVEDTIQSALASRSYAELRALETKFRVKHEIQAKVNSFLHDTAITEVLFQSFIVQ